MHKAQKNIMASLLLATSIVGPQARAAVGGQQMEPGSVALVLSQSAQNLNIPAVELYRSVSIAVEEGRFWGIATMREVSANMPKRGRLASLGVVPAFDRKLLVTAHPEAISMRPGFKVRKGNKDLIAPVQTMLDTMALKGAVIVDCVPKDSRTVTGCGLYYYDRAAGKVVASTRKYFRTGVHDATAWSYSLVAGLAGGMQAAAVAQEKSKLNELLKKGEETENTIKPALELKAFSRSMTGPLGSLKSMPGLSLLVGAEEETYSFGLEMTYGQAQADTHGAQLRINERAALFSVTAEARALDSLVWDLGLGIGFSQRLVASDQSETVDNSAAATAASMAVPVGTSSARNQLDSRSIVLQMAPGLMWELSKTLSFGTQFQFTRYVPVSTKAQGTFEGESLNNSSLGIAFRLRGTL